MAEHASTQLSRRLILRPELHEVSRAREFLREMAGQTDLPEARAFDLCVAASEACANAIEHTGGSGEVRLDAHLYLDRMEVLVRGPGEFGVPVAGSEREHRGLGLPLMATLADHLALYSTPDGGTLVTLTFYRPGATRSSSPLPPSLAELLARHSLFEEVLDGLPDAFVVFDYDWRYRYANDKGVANAGKKSMEDLLGELRWDVFPEYDRAAREAEEVAMVERRPVTTISCYAPTGSWWESRAFPVPEGLAIVSRDITKRQRIEEALNEQLRSLELLSKSATHLLQPLPSEELFNYAALQLQTLSGRSLVVVNEYHLDRNAIELKALVGPEDKLQGLRAALGRDPVGLVFTMPKGTRERIVPGELQHVEGGLYDLAFNQLPLALCQQLEERLELGRIYAMPFILGRDLLGMVGIITDRLEGLRNQPGLESLVNQVALALKRCRAEESLLTIQTAQGPKREQDVLAAIMESTHANLAYLDPDFNFVLVNSAYEVGSGHSAAELLGKNHFSFFPNEENEALFRTVRDSGEARSFTSKPFVYENQPWRKTTYWDWSLTPVKNPAGSVVGLVLSLADVTAQTKARLLSEALNELNLVLSSRLDLEPTLPRLCQRAQAATAADGVMLAVVEAGRGRVAQASGLLECLTGTWFDESELELGGSVKGARQIFPSEEACSDLAFQRKLQEELGLEVLLCVRLKAGPKVRGYLLFGSRHRSEFDPLIVDFAIKLGTSISLALANSRLYEAQRAIAASLQAPLLALPASIPGIKFAHLYRSATKQAIVGGDFYDLVTVDERLIGLVVGDVSGHGVDAARTGATMRDMLRAYASSTGSPAEALDLANEALLKDSSFSGFVTVLVAVLDAASGALTYCSAGHPPGIIRRPDGSSRWLATTSPPLGVFEDASFRPKRTVLEPGDVLLMYTDGLIEARAKVEPFGEARLKDALAQTLSLGLAEVPSRLLDAAAQFSGGRLQDDIAVLAVEVPPRLDRGPGRQLALVEV